MAKPCKWHVGRFWCFYIVGVTIKSFNYNRKISKICRHFVLVWKAKPCIYIKNGRQNHVTSTFRDWQNHVTGIPLMRMYLHGFASLCNFTYMVLPTICFQLHGFANQLFSSNFWKYACSGVFSGVLGKKMIYLLVTYCISWMSALVKKIRYSFASDCLSGLFWSIAKYYITLYCILGILLFLWTKQRCSLL